MLFNLFQKRELWHSSGSGSPSRRSELKLKLLLLLHCTANLISSSSSTPFARRRCRYSGSSAQLAKVFVSWPPSLSHFKVEDFFALYSYFSLFATATTAVVVVEYNDLYNRQPFMYWLGVITITTTQLLNCSVLYCVLPGALLHT